MPGMGPPPKPYGSAARHRWAKPKATAALLTAPEPDTVTVPTLPAREQGWHDLTKAWWRNLWHSPMAAEYEPSDVHGLYVLAAVINDFWRAQTAKDRASAAAEGRLQAARYGLSPIDRRRLQWEIERTDEAQERGARRRSNAVETVKPEPGKTALPGGQAGPRAILRFVSPPDRLS